MSSSITRRRIESTMEWSCVAISTVVPVRLIRSSNSMMSWLVSGSRLPVGSSASSRNGRLTNARAIATRCCSPPESSLGMRSALPSRPTRSSTSGTTLRIVSAGLPITSRANATFSPTDLLGSSRKSWNTQPMRCRSRGTRRRGSLATLRSFTVIVPRVGTSSRSRSRRNVDLPDPEGPMRKTNSPLSISAETRSSAGRVEVLYTLVTRSRRITAGRLSAAATEL